MKLYKGIFWYDPRENELIGKKALCDKNGAALEDVEYSSKSGDNFNHEREWERFSKEITGKKPFNYFPRGRVEVKSGKTTVYLNPALNTLSVVGKIYAQFGLDTLDISVRVVADASAHYGYIIDY